MLKTSNDGRKLLLNFDVLAQAPEGVAKLRELILTLAVQGKLVPQDASDEPARVLLQRIQAEKARLVAEGKIKKEKPLPEITEEEKPFELPVGWEWVRLSEVVRVLNGRAYAKQELLDGGEFPVLRVGNLFTSNHWYYSDLILEPEKYCEQGDLLYAWSASFGPFIWGGPKSIYHYHIWKLEPWSRSGFNTQFFHRFLEEKTAEIKAAGHGVSMLHMTKEKMEKIVVALAPLAEQSRIVARVESLMQLCDALEAKGQLEARQHQQLLQALLGSLTQSADANELAHNWQRVAAHFDLLLGRPEAIDALEQTILQLAVRGLLVPQDPADEPASELACKAVKRRFADSKKSAAPPVSENEKLFDIPEYWVWERLGNIFDGGSGSTPLRSRSDYFEDATELWIKTTDLNLDVVFKGEENISIKAVLECNLKYFEPNTVCIAMYGGAGTIGKSGILGARTTINQSVFALPPVEFVNPNYLHIFVMAVRSRWMSFAAGLRKDPNINGQIIKNMPFPLPPLAEQSRIVTRVNELRALCQQLREQLSQARHTQSLLAQAWVEQAAA